MAGETTELESFRRFLEVQIERGAFDLSPEESVRLWRAEFSKSVEAVQEALSDMEAGDRGRPIREVADEIRNRHGWTTER